MPNHGRRAQGVGKRGDAVKRAGSRFLEGRLIVPAIGFRTVFVDVVRISVTSFRLRRYRRLPTTVDVLRERPAAGRFGCAFRFHGPSATRWNATYDINFRNGARQRHARPLLRNSPLAADCSPKRMACKYPAVISSISVAHGRDAASPHESVFAQEVRIFVVIWH